MFLAKDERASVTRVPATKIAVEVGERGVARNAVGMQALPRAIGEAVLAVRVQ